MPGPDTSAYRMADRLAGGELADLLGQYRRAGVAWRAIARLLLDEFGIEASADTLKAWAEELAAEAVA